MQVVWEDKPEPPRPPRPLLLDPDTLERARCAADGYSASEKAQYALRCKKLPQDAVSVILRRRRQIEEDNDLLCAIAGIREPDIVAALGAVIPWKIPSEEVSQM
jgi:hypothetical protein